LWSRGNPIFDYSLKHFQISEDWWIQKGPFFASLPRQAPTWHAQSVQVS
jgi:hypothetical protein